MYIFNAWVEACAVDVKGPSTTAVSMAPRAPRRVIFILSWLLLLRQVIF